MNIEGEFYGECPECGGTTFILEDGKEIFCFDCDWRMNLGDENES